MPHCDKDETGQNALFDIMYLNNTRTGKGATKPRTLGFLGHSVFFLSTSMGHRTEISFTVTKSINDSNTAF